MFSSCTSFLVRRGSIRDVTLAVGSDVVYWTVEVAALVGVTLLPYVTYQRVVSCQL